MLQEAQTLKKLIAEKNTTLEAVASVLGIDRSTLYRKLKGGISKLTISEALKISAFLDLSDSETSSLFWRQ